MFSGMIAASSAEAMGDEPTTRVTAVDSTSASGVVLSSAAAGGNVKVRLHQPLPDGSRPTVLIGLKPCPEVGVDPNDATVLNATVPLDLLPPGSLKPQVFDVVVSDGGIPFDGKPQLTVYPEVRAQVAEVNHVDQNVSRDAQGVMFPEATLRPYEEFTVSGTGFLAPSEQIVFQLRASDATTQAQTLSVDPEGKFFVARFNGVPDELRDKLRGEVPFDVTVFGTFAAPPQRARVFIENPQFLDSCYGSVVILSFVPVLLMWVAIYVLCLSISRFRSYRQAPPPGGRNSPRPWIETALVDPQTNTYSLSSTQFLWWITIIVYCYAFIF